MPTGPNTAPEPEGPEQPEQPERSRGPERRRVIMEPGGPVLVEGPVEIDLPDGGTLECDRFMVALCTCRRSRRFPLCDTSHRRRR
ncbi:CDGSH iron-sulfur domain-containing protein [Thermomonospora umbrina]|uniref:Iron-binding CDGSH zinc finger protein n=1 Tax=Thermomonospora umbrina TaxID=111806 RepID=A0A3D9T8V0_9ACTN|nr:iron-binding CDGSH zinc finger protein [Thermomonospora umbrina]